MPVAPYPLGALAKLGRAEVTDLRRWARAVPLGGLVRGGLEASAWLGSPLEVTPGVPANVEGSSTSQTVEPSTAFNISFW